MIDTKRKIDPFTLPYVMMSELKFLPTCSGVYFAIEESGQVAYIGQSINIRQRWRAHHVQGDLCDLNDLQSARRIRIAWMQVEKADLDRIEVELIKCFKPRLNVSHILDEVKATVGRIQSNCPVKLAVRKLAEANGIKNPKQLSEKSGVPYAACYAIWNGEQKQIALETINKFCQALNVKPGKLFEYTRDE